MAVLHITKSELARDVDGVLEKVRAGAEVVIEDNNRAVAVIKTPPLPKTPQRHGRMLSDCIALADAHGSTATLDDEFGKDLEEIIQSHPEPLASRWD
jgi:antitoxin (DNA-binding transcriptional repressor) of toxin-antitoxin stability system